MMTMEQIGEWIKSQVPANARKAVLAYALELAVAEDLRQRCKEVGVSDTTLKMVELAGPTMLGQLQKMVGIL